MKSVRDVVLVWNGLVAEPPRLARRGKLGEEGRPSTGDAGAVEVPDATGLAKAYPVGPSSPVRGSSVAKTRR